MSRPWGRIQTRLWHFWHLRRLRRCQPSKSCVSSPFPAARAVHIQSDSGCTVFARHPSIGANPYRPACISEDRGDLHGAGDAFRSESPAGAAEVTGVSLVRATLMTTT
jgi:hypothetical protein